MSITPAAATFSKLVQQGALTNDVEIQLNNNFAASPNVVASVASTGVGFAAFNTAAAVNLVGATAPAGLYRATVYLLETTTFVTNTTTNVTIGWTDASQAQTNIVTTTSTLTAGTFVSGTVTFQSAGTAAITYTPGKTGSAATGGVASIYVVLERLQ